MMPGEAYKAYLILWLNLAVKSSKDHKGSLHVLITKHTPLPSAKQSKAAPGKKQHFMCDIYDGLNSP